MIDTERFDFLVNFINAYQWSDNLNRKNQRFKNLIDQEMLTPDQVRKLIDKANEHD